MKRTIKIVYMDGSEQELALKGFSTLPSTMKKSFSINETKDGNFFLCVSESLIPDMTKVSRLEIVRE